MMYDPINILLQRYAPLNNSSPSNQRFKWSLDDYDNGSNNNNDDDVSSSSSLGVAKATKSASATATKKKKRKQNQQHSESDDMVIQVETSHESCCGETSAGLTWLFHTILKKNDPKKSVSSGNNNNFGGYSDDDDDDEDDDQDADMKTVLRNLLKSVNLNEELFDTSSNSALSSSSLGKDFLLSSTSTSDHEVKKEGKENGEGTISTPSSQMSISLFEHLLQTLINHPDSNTTTIKQEQSDDVTKANQQKQDEPIMTDLQIINTCHSTFFNQPIKKTPASNAALTPITKKNINIAKNMPPGLDTNQCIQAALLFLSSSIQHLGLEDGNDTDNSTSSFSSSRNVSSTEPLYFFPNMPLLLSTSSDDIQGITSKGRQYRLNESIIKSPNIMKNPKFLQKLKNLESMFWSSSKQYPSRFHFLPRITPTTTSTTESKSKKSDEILLRRNKEYLLLIGRNPTASSSSSSSAATTAASKKGPKRKSIDSGNTSGNAKPKKKKAKVTTTPPPDTTLVHPHVVTENMKIEEGDDFGF